MCVFISRPVPNPAIPFGPIIIMTRSQEAAITSLKAVINRLGMKNSPKHRDISRQLLAEIATGKHDPAGRLPSEAQLVKRFGVSRPTVARALRDLQSEGLIERRAGSGT
jgi:DNA-binding GntR family transcriptional regulator